MRTERKLQNNNGIVFLSIRRWSLKPMAAVVPVAEKKKLDFLRLNILEKMEKNIAKKWEGISTIRWLKVDFRKMQGYPSYA